MHDSLKLAATLSATVFLTASAHGQRAARTLPPPGITLDEPTIGRLQETLGRLNKRINNLESDATLRPDVEIFAKAVGFALRHGEFYHEREAGWAANQLQTAHRRLDALFEGQSPWTEARGRVVRGFRSALDDSVQPYGIEIPEDLDLSKPAPLVVWLHGRGDKMTDLHFIRRRQTRSEYFAATDSLVLHPFGRYCNGYKSAGEIDVFEAIDAVCRAYPVDRDRILLAGFSMGGAGAWHLAAHYPDRWVAMNAGAGFAETRRYQQLRPEAYPPWYEQTLWNLYDVPVYTRNLFNLPVIAYSGELDKQKQAADLMASYFERHGRSLTHLVGPGVAHKMHPETLAEIRERLSGFVERGLGRSPTEVHLQTRTLRYNQCHWVELLGLEVHWRDSRVDAKRLKNGVKLSTQNVTALRIGPKAFGPGVATVTIDGNDVAVTIDSEGVLLERFGSGWRQTDRLTGLRKTPGLQGPIDDAFLAPFLVVTPTGDCAHPQVQRWVDAELARFLERWRLLFRGEARVKRDDAVTEEEMRRFHLILWGDPSANSLLGKLMPQIPATWTADHIAVGDQAFDAGGHVLSMIYPNPLPAGAGRYVVLNSGMTFREAHDRTNSLQNPKLPDWAVLDLSQPPSNASPGRIADAAFFDERWKYQSERGPRYQAGE